MRTPHDSEPLVTIAIPTYNRAATFLPISLSAACKQTYRNLEVLVSDNASGDATCKVVEGFADRRIRYHRHEMNIGAAGNLDFCIRESRGKYTLLLMDDDSIDPDFVECCISAVGSNPEAGLVRTGTRVVNGEGQVTYDAHNLAAGLDFAQFVVAWTEGLTAPFLCSTMFRTEPLQRVGMHSRHDLWNDVISELEIAFHYGRVDIPDIKASYLMHPGELSVRAGIQEWCEDSRQLIDLVCNLSPGDADLLRRRLTPYLAMLNYRTAARLEKPWHTRVAAGYRVYRAFGALPKVTFFRELVGETSWFQALREVKRFLVGPKSDEPRLFVG